MGMETATSWLIVRRYDIINGSSSPQDVKDLKPVCIHLKYESNYTEIKSQLRSLLGISENGSEVFKLRKKDGSLVTLSTLLQENTECDPLFLDVVQIHQNTPASPRVAFSPTYVETVKNKLVSLEKRVARVESLIPELRTHRLVTIERTIQQLGTKVNFLDKRLDDLAPLEWKAHFQQVTAE